MKNFSIKKRSSSVVKIFRLIDLRGKRKKRWGNLVCVCAVSASNEGVVSRCYENPAAPTWVFFLVSLQGLDV